jgi:hypothetical protein
MTEAQIAQLKHALETEDGRWIVIIKEDTEIRSVLNSILILNKILNKSYQVTSNGVKGKGEIAFFVNDDTIDHKLGYYLIGKLIDGYTDLAGISEHIERRIWACI